MTAAFSVGDMVSCSAQAGGQPLSYIVVKVMPTEHDVCGYHIRDPAEPFERSATEFELKKAGSSSAERAFALRVSHFIPLPIVSLSRQPRPLTPL